MKVRRMSELAVAGMMSLGLAAAGCGNVDDADGPESGEEQTAENGDMRTGGGGTKADSSVEATFLDFSFHAEFTASNVWDEENAIEDHMLYTVGQLNGDNSVGRIDKLDLTNVEVQDEGEYERVVYDVELLVAWGDRENVPENYTFQLPADMTTSGKQEFVDAYADDCVSYSAHDVTPNSMWYYYRPATRGCELAEEDVYEAEATVEQSEVETTGKYPEYHKVWEDEVLKVTAVFGKDEDGATTSDPGIRAYNEFAGLVREELDEYGMEVEPEGAPRQPGAEVPYTVYRALLEEGREVEIHAFLVDNVRNARPEFDEKYEELSRDSDLLVYNGHSGLGSNIRAMAEKGDWQEGQYNIVFMDGCDTYAYVDSALADANAAVNPDDDVGTKYLDLVMNAMPAYFRENANSTMALVRGLMSYEEPMTYEEMFQNIDSSQVVLVSGEQDNEFEPGMLDQ